MKKYNFNKFGIFLLSVFMMGTVGCTDDLNINSDPLAALEVDPSLLFPTIMVSVSQNRTIELGPQTEFWSQQWTSGGSAGVFRNPEIYITSPNSTNNLFVGQYSTALRNLQQIRVLTLRNNPEADNIIGQAKVFESFVFLNLTLFYGDIPFSEATQVVEFPNPNFDMQEQVLRGIVDRLDEGIDLLSTETDIITNGDLLYNGDRQAWIRFANTLKLKTLMLIANKDPSVAPQIQAVANSSFIMENSQNAYFPYSEEVGNENPLWRLINNFSGGENAFLFSGSTLVDIMNNNDDPRRATYFDEVEDGGYVGQDQGVFSSAGISPVSLNILRPDLEDRYATASESYYLLAEAAIKGFISGDAQEFYTQGLMASLDSYDGQPGEIAQADKDAYLASSRGSLDGLTNDKAIQQISEEQYVALFTRGLEAWTHWKRTKTPDFMLPVDAVVGDIIRRIQIPLSEISSNPNAPDVVPITTPMWFEN
ncbi:SusD-like starch-binding protein associating with outer membrane [Gillisia sp. Hel_I_86]|uniref:SusD/RagB family nutrient-binding outer membrane lipoprotein n=1 Tax=Gillisia sp. Hel_I_86 TaxID=1249981 RepID=UPI00119C1A03|nr:SusD/RagB family nutrient-binding outer membrane lipoprotein [Gillisia sp. Hel_I_86]TVZ26881.1 SusD-like starch-binding protein associating with outer membrane [Gillisia sp. Hel_I_86]